MPRPEPIAEVPAFDGPLHVPRFSILHVVVWMLASIVLFCIYLAADIVYGRIQSEVGPWTTYLLQGVGSALFGAVLVGAGILVRFSRIAKFNRLQPGHWLIINFAIVGLIGLLAWPSWRGNPTEQTTNMFISLAICTMVTGLLYCYVAMQLNYARRWKAFFGFAAAMSFLASAFDVLIIHPDILRQIPATIITTMLLDYGSLLFLAAFVMCLLITVTIFLVAIVIDVREKCRRDWLHWMGITVVAISPLIAGVWHIARRLALP